MNVLALLGSPRKNGNTSFLLDEYLKGLGESNSETEIVKVFLQEKHIRPCAACNACHNRTPGKCAIKDDMRELYPLFQEAKLVVFATPVYWCGVSAQLKAFLDRLNAFDVEGGEYFKGKMISLIMTHGIEAPNKGPQLIKAQFEEICNYTGMDLRVSYSTCSTRYPHIREDAAACKGAYHAGRIVSF